LGRYRSKCKGTDGNDNGIVNVADCSVWRDHLGQMAGSGAALPSASPLSAGVPDPSSIALNVTSLAAMMLNRPTLQRRIANHLPKSIP